MKRTNSLLSFTLVSSFLIGAFGLLLTPQQAKAVPAFARQMGVSCNTCHFQHFPELNSFGRAFKASGFTMTGTPTIDQGSTFSLPSNLNAAIFTNLRYQKSNGQNQPSTSGGHSSSNDGSWIFPGETSLFVGGRVSQHVGALVEGDVGAAGAASGNGFLASIKIPMVHKIGSTKITGDINGGIVPFSAGLGPAYAFEIMNTGAVGNHFMNLVNEAAMSGLWYMQSAHNFNGDSNAEGIGAFAESSDFFVTLAEWDPNHSIVDAVNASSSPTSHYVRVAVTPQLGRWDTGFGFLWYGGQSVMVSDMSNVYKTHMWGVDGQMQGNVTVAGRHMPLGVYVSYSQAPGSSGSCNAGAGSGCNLYNAGTRTRRVASVAAELGAFDQGRATVQLGYRWAQNGFARYNIDNAYTVGLTYLPWDNVQFGIWQSFYSGSAHSAAALNYALAGGSNPIHPAYNAAAVGTMADSDLGGSGHELTSVNLAVGF